jgi:hypothetical protein
MKPRIYKWWVSYQKTWLHLWVAEFPGYTPQYFSYWDLALKWALLICGLNERTKTNVLGKIV